MFTLHFWFMSTINLLTLQVIIIALLYLTKIVDLWLETRTKEHRIFARINLFISEATSFISIILVFLLPVYVFVMGIIVILI